RGGLRKVYGPGPAQYVGYPLKDLSAVDHHRRRQVGRDHDSYGPPLPKCPGIGREEVLALRPIRRNSPPHQCRAAAASYRGDPHRRHELIKFLGGVRRLFRSTRSASLEHERAKTDLKALIPDDAKEAIGHGVRAKRKNRAR